MSDSDHDKILEHIEKHGIEQKDSIPKTQPKRWYGDPEQTFDLHRLTEDEAIFKLKEEFESFRLRKDVTVKIVVGKGKHSKTRAVLKPAVLRWLKGAGRKYVKRVHEIKDTKGEIGAILVLLK